MRTLALGVVLGLAGCKFPEPPPVGEDAATDAPVLSCQDNGPDLDCPAASPLCIDGTCSPGCDTDAECAGRPQGQTICHAESGGCGQCDESDRQAEPMTVEDECRDPAATVCDGATHTCRGCESNDECFDGLCAAGRCIPESEIVFVDTAGSDGGACGTRALPCLTLNTAISRVQTTRSYILMAPSSTPYQARNNADRADFNTVAAHVIGAGAILHRIGDGLVLDVRANSDVTIDGLTIEQATGIAGHGIQCTSSTLTLHNVTVRNNAGDGVIGSGCTFTASGSTIAANRLLGIELVSSDVDLSRSTIDGNRGGGVLVTSGSFKIVNNFVVNNGHISESLVGGLDVASAGVSNVLEFNTVVRNTAQLGQSDGIKCVSAGLVARNNIIAGSTSDRQHATGNCAYAYSLFTPNNVVNGEMNSLVPDFAMYNFVSNADFHLQAGSVAIGRAQNTNLAGESGFDIDGDVRSGNEVDVGADEIP